MKTRSQGTPVNTTASTAQAAIPRRRRKAFDGKIARVSESSFLEALYSENDVFLTNNINNGVIDKQITDFIRRARLTRFLHERAPSSGRPGRRKVSLKLVDRSHNEALSILVKDVDLKLEIENTRLGALFAAVHALVIYTCACPKVFRQLIGQEDIAGCLEWTDIHDLIISNRDSIELFGITRGLKPTQLLRTHDAHYGRLLAEDEAFWKVLNRSPQPIGTFTLANFGIPPGDNISRQSTVPPGTYEPHLWYIPHPSAPTVQRTLQYKVTKDLKRYHSPAGIASANIASTQSEN